MVSHTMSPGCALGYWQPRTARIRFALPISRFAWPTVSFLPDWACASLTKALSKSQALDASPPFIALRASIAFCSFVSRLFVIPKGLLKVPTREIRFDSCSTAPLTVTVRLPVEELLAASVAVQFTVVGPIAKMRPDCGMQDTVVARLYPTTCPRLLMS